ncbi:MAG: hypothetical protein QOF76_404 [Solirubrobacteraceae bacterium]|jgi:hypothetical protein|nr:hypothetical protein [Solirubrobacteraceae bacterium]
MLFDLRGRGRRNTIKVIYAFLAFLMGGSLVLLGFGTGGNGGLLDAITGNGSSSSNSGSDRYKNQEKAALLKLKTNPNDVGALESLVGARVQLAGLDDNYDVAKDTYTKSGLDELRRAAQAWETLGKLKPAQNDALGDAANRMTGAYIALNQPEKLLDAQLTFASIRQATGPFQQAAQIAYQLGNTTIGDRAAQQAIDLAPADQRPTVKSDMDELKKQAAGASASPAAITPVPTTTAEASATAKPKATATAKPKAKSKTKK